MNKAQAILNPALDRQPKERRDMAEYYAVQTDWVRDVEICRFADGSALMMVLDADLCPTEFLAV